MKSKEPKKTTKKIDPLDAALEYAIDKEELDSVDVEDMIFTNVLRDVLKVKPLWGDD